MINQSPKNFLKVYAPQFTHSLILLWILSCPVFADEWMGEYDGVFQADSQTQMPATAVVIAEERQDYRVVIKASPEDSKIVGVDLELYGRRYGSRVEGRTYAGGYHWNLRIADGKLSASSAYGQHLKLEKIQRQSPNLGLVPPSNAIALLPLESGKVADLSAWTNQNWKALEDGVMQCVKGKGSNRTRQSFGSIKHFHIEFKLPLEPDNRGQGRGNSGLIFNRSYEVQILDSFGVSITAGDCGSLYDVVRAKMPERSTAYNAYLPPGTWQTYDVTFQAPKLGPQGKVLSLPRITVQLNGVKIHDDVEIPHPTANKNAKHKPSGPIELQDHGHPIEFRNIWIVED